MNSEELYRKCKAWDSSAWEQANGIVKQIANWHGSGLSPEDREDAAQGALLYWIENLDRVDQPRSFISLLRKKTKCLLIDKLRMGNRWKTVSINPAADAGDDKPSEVPLADPGQDALKGTADRQLCKRLLELIGRVATDQCRDLLLRYYLYKLTGEKLGRIAEEFGLTAAQANNLIYPCIQVLRQHPEFQELFRQWRSR